MTTRSAAEIFHARNRVFWHFFAAQARREKKIFAETGAARDDGQKSKSKTKKERIGIKTIKNIKK